MVFRRSGDRRNRRLHDSDRGWLWFLNRSGEAGGSLGGSLSVVGVASCGCATLVRRTRATRAFHLLVGEGAGLQVASASHDAVFAAVSEPATLTAAPHDVVL